MIKAVHIEDEPNNIELLSKFVKTYCADKVTLMGSAKNIRDAVELIKFVQPQLVYLDIELNDGNAFDLLEELKGFSFQVIFITAFNEYAVKAFRLNAVDYLLKPIDISELTEATNRAAEKIYQLAGNENVQSVIKQLKLSNGVQKIAFPVTDGMLFISAEEIVKAAAKANFTQLYLVNGNVITASKNLKQIESLLQDNGFIRVHHSWVINTKYLKKYFRGKNGYMEMEDGSTVPVSQRKKGDFLYLLNEESH